MFLSHFTRFFSSSSWHTVAATLWRTLYGCDLWKKRRRRSVSELEHSIASWSCDADVFFSRSCKTYSVYKIYCVMYNNHALRFGWYSGTAHARAHDVWQKGLNIPDTHIFGFIAVTLLSPENALGCLHVLHHVQQSRAMPTNHADDEMTTAIDSENSTKRRTLRVLLFELHMQTFINSTRRSYRLSRSYLRQTDRALVSSTKT